MDILGIGPLELVLILVIALLVFGPDKLPEIGAKLGKGVRDLRQLSREISQGVNTITEPMDELRKPFDDASQVVDQISAGAAALRNPAQALQNSIEKQLAAPSAEPAAAVQTAAVQTAEDNTIAPPRSAESVEPAAPVAALAVTTVQRSRSSRRRPLFSHPLPLLWKSQLSASTSIRRKMRRLTPSRRRTCQDRLSRWHPLPSHRPRRPRSAEHRDDAVADLPTIESAAQTSER